MLLAVALGFAAFVVWRHERLPALPHQPSRPLADIGAVKQDLLTFARAERVFYASSGRYAAMHELRTEGLLSLPPQTRWPYSYYVFMPSAERFVVVAMAQGPFGGRPLALAIDENMEMHELDHRDLMRPDQRYRRQTVKRVA